MFTSKNLPEVPITIDKRNGSKAILTSLNSPAIAEIEVSMMRPDTMIRITRIVVIACSVSLFDESKGSISTSPSKFNCRTLIARFGT